jgi:HSP20 family molecular chaperone IbpA
MFALKPSTNRMPALFPRTEAPFSWMPGEFTTFFHRFFPVPETFEWPYGWGVTTEEKEKEVILRMELPGFELEEIKVELLGERLTVEAEHKEPAEKAEEKTERVHAHAKRVLTLPAGVELEKAEVVYRSGVLKVYLPRKPETMGRRIEVKT